MRLHAKMLSFAISCFVTGCQLEESDEIYPIEPSITFQDIFFKNAPSGQDSIVLTFSFTDGDGNIGFKGSYGNDVSTSYEELSSPYNYYNFFTKSGGLSNPITYNYKNFPDAVSPYQIVLNSPENDNSSLITVRNFGKLGFEFLPVLNEDKLNCIHYSIDTLLAQLGSFLLSPDLNVVDTIADPTGNKYAVILDTLFFQPNKNFYNIDVDFLVKQANGDFEEFNFRTAFLPSACGNNFDERLPLFSKGKINPPPFTIDARSSKSGNISYHMMSYGFLSLFSTKTLKLRVKIRDRDLQESNAIETPEFTLQSITR